jgi:hypothetical protein
MTLQEAEFIANEFNNLTYVQSAEVVPNMDGDYSVLVTRTDGRRAVSCDLDAAVCLNLGKKGTSFSVDGHGLTTTISERGVKETFSIPGVGISFTTRCGKRRRKNGETSLGHGMPDKSLGPAPECASVRPQTPVGATKAHPQSGFPGALLLAGSQVRSCSTDGQTSH